MRPVTGGSPCTGAAPFLRNLTSAPSRRRRCYVGKQRLDRALAAYSPLKGRRIDVRWHAFMIDTASAPAGVHYQAYCERRWGGDGWCTMAGFPHGCASAACPASFYCFFCCQA